MKPAADADALQQFFISLVNHSETALTLQSFHASAGCGWVQEPVAGDLIAAGDERVWCGMPWDLACPVEVDLDLGVQGGGAIRIRFSRRYPAPADGSLQLDAAHLLGSAELQRAESSSPFLMTIVRQAF
ncbi:hypothetical protein FNU76_07590 [Chitinimonas arctica]|uniref:Uncharacterized protein n=1 Tax=Chitinimonas arctica TaxID=2594795 RepID=A0A516SDJ3_9NEIS|nr:hypothetical protein [Chitinimonas arctica]QDQ26233.1 hypothetical protein FNU76_07590 [Chitinimonas arctica]